MADKTALSVTKNKGPPQAGLCPLSLEEDLTLWGHEGFVLAFSAFVRTALNRIIARNAISTVNVTAVTLPRCHRRSQRTAGASRKLSIIASAIGTMTSRAKYKSATTNPTVSRTSTPKKPDGI